MKLEKEQVKEIIPSIKRYVEEEFGEEIGNLKAELLLDYFNPFSSSLSPFRSEHS